MSDNDSTATVDLSGLEDSIDRACDTLDQMRELVGDVFAERAELLAALRAHDTYMRDAGYSGPNDPALHKNAAANWERVRAAIDKAEGR